MGDTAMTVVVIFLAAIVMFIPSLMTTADKKDDITALSIQTATTEFTNSIRTTGGLTQDEYDNFILTLGSTGNSYDVEITIQILDENPAKKSSGATVIGDNVYYTIYTTQVLESLPLSLKEGDIVSVSVKNTNTTIGQQLRNAMYKVTGNSESTIAAEESGIVTTTKN